MSDLTQFRDHCRRMSESEHKPECPSLTREPSGGWVLTEPDNPMSGMTWHRPKPRPSCDGCVTDADRALFAQLAGEVDAYLGGQFALFGGDAS